MIDLLGSLFHVDMVRKESLLKEIMYFLCDYRIDERVNLFQTINHLDLKFFIMLTAAFVGGMNLFLYSFFGHLAIDFYLNLSDDLFESKWHQFPLNLQKYLIIMMVNSQ